MREAAREEHLRDLQAKAKCKRKRGKQPPKGDTPANPPSPQRDAKKVKGPDEKAEVSEPGPPAEGVEAVPGESRVEGKDNPKAKSKRPDAETVKAAWVEKE